MQEMQERDWEDPLEEEMANHSSILAWRIPRTEDPGGLQSIGSQRVRTEHTHTHRRTLPTVGNGLGVRSGSY